MFAVACVVFVLIYTAVNIILVWLRNLKAQQFFKIRSPNLPVLPNPNIFAGHIYQVTLPQKNWQIITDLHKLYGPTFGFYMCNQPWVSTKDLDLIKLIEVDQAPKHINRANFGSPFEEINNSIFQVDDDDWRKVRRAISPALTNLKVRSNEVSNDIRSILGQLTEALEFKVNEAKEKTGERALILDVHDTFQRYSLAVIFLITYKRDNIIDFYAKTDPWVNLVEQGARDVSNPLVAFAVMFPFLRPLCRFLAEYSPVGSLLSKLTDYLIKAADLNRSAREHHEKFQRKISIQTGAPERRFSDVLKQGQFKRRLVDTFIDSFIDKNISYEHFVGSTLFLVLAGFETTADTITCLVWHLVQQPEIQERLRESIAKEGLDSHYLMWCIQETVRWHPAVPLGTGRVLGEDVHLNGLHLARGTFVMPSTHSIHHDPAIWTKPDQFDPDRWHYQSIFHPASFMGFGLGPRNCVGGKLAVHEIKLVMQMLLSKYRILKCADTCDEYNFSSPGLIYTLLDQPIKVKLVPLEESS